MLSQFQANQSTYGAPKPAAGPSPFARPQTAPINVRPGMTMGMGGVGGIAGPSGGVIQGSGSGGRPPAPPPPPPAPPRPAPQAAPTPTALPAPQAGPDPFDEFLKNFRMPEPSQPQAGGQPAPATPIPIAPDPTPLPQPGATTINNAAAPQTPDVGGGWADFAQRPQGPAGLGFGPQRSAATQTLRAVRAGGGVY